MLRDRNVIVVLKSFHFGGAERYALLLARHLAATRGARVSVLGFSDPDGRAAVMCERDGIPHELVPVRLHKKLRKLTPALLRLALRLRQKKPDVLLPFLNTPNVACGVLWRLVGADTCIWNQQNLGSDATGRRIEKRAIRETPCFVANSRAGGDFLIGAGAAPERVHVILNGVELSPPAADAETWRRHLGVDGDCMLAAAVAHFAPRKDHATLIEAWAKVTAQLERSGRRAVLLLAGKPGATYEPSRELARELGVGGSIQFLGEVEDVSGLLHTVDLGVLSSRHEGCPNAVQEYMAAGLAVVATDLLGVRDAFEDYSSLAAPGDAESMAERITRYLTDSDLRRETGARNRRHVETSFSARRMCRAWDSLLASCLNGAPPGLPST